MGCGCRGLWPGPLTGIDRHHHLALSPGLDPVSLGTRTMQFHSRAPVDGLIGLVIWEASMAKSIASRLRPCDSGRLRGTVSALQPAASHGSRISDSLSDLSVGSTNRSRLAGEGVPTSEVMGGLPGASSSALRRQHERTSLLLGCCGSSRSSKGDGDEWKDDECRLQRIE